MAVQFAEKFSERELDQLYASFLSADEDNSGSLDFVEFSKLFAGHVNVEDQIAKWFKVFDKNGDGRCDIKEFTTALAISTKGSPQQKLEALFNIYDTNKDKNLSPDEIEALLNHLKKAASKVLAGISEGDKDDEVSNKFAKAIIDKLDVNKDGNISLDEWTTRGEKTPALLNLLGLTSFSR